MFAIIGIVTVFAMVFGGYLLAGGKMALILKALPFEMMMIGGAAVGTFLIGNGGATVGKAAKSLGKVFGGPSFKKQDFVDVLCLMFTLLKLAKTKGVIAIEPHIEKPDESKIFQAYPKIAKDHFAVDLICDSMRMITMGMDDPHQFEEIVNKELEKHHHELGRAQGAIQTVADALPRARHRRRGARRHQDHGLDQRAAGDPRQDDRRRAGRHLPRDLPRLRLLRPLRRTPEADLRRRPQVLRDHPRHDGGPSPRPAAADRDRDRPQEHPVGDARVLRPARRGDAGIPAAA
jgi:hypothetical protein